MRKIHVFSLVALLALGFSGIYNGKAAVDDFMVYDSNSGNWYGLSIEGNSDVVIAWAQSWGWPGATTVPGDYNGDGKSDLAVYDQNSGTWYILSVDGQVILWATQWGWPGAETVPGDYDGDGISDLGVYDQNSGMWYILSVAGEIIGSGIQWGWYGAEPVPSDYDGDGKDDLAVYDQNSGTWYILSVQGELIAWQVQWGWPGARPVPADYDGDGKCDLGVYDQYTGNWYVISLAGNAIALGIQWGWLGAETVRGDYDGDGKNDFAVYNQNNGAWYILSMTGNVIAWEKPWGWVGAQVVPGNYYDVPGDDPDEYIPAKPDPAYDNFTWTLPSTASSVRLSLPTDVNNFLLDEHGGIGGYGLCAGGHIEGLDHVWIEFVLGTPARSWAPGTVMQITLNGEAPDQEYHIWIDYGDNLVGIHMEIMTPYVSAGDTVARGQEVGMGMSFNTNQTSGEMMLIDRGRTDGVQAWGGGTSASPFDYLRDADKRLLVDAYRTNVIEPYQNDGTKAWAFEPQQPYLTNKLRLHDDNDGKLTGVWYLPTNDWAFGYPNDIMTFVEANNPYFTGNTIKSQDRTGSRGDVWSIHGTVDVDYVNGKIILYGEYVPPYYGIFEIDETGALATMKIEYQQNSYPTGFSSNALTYTEREY